MLQEFDEVDWESCWLANLPAAELIGPNPHAGQRWPVFPLGTEGIPHLFYLFCDCSIEQKFKEASVRTSFTRCALTVAIVNKNFHR